MIVWIKSIVHYTRRMLWKETAFVLTTSSFNEISTTKAMLKSRVDWTFGRWLDSLHKIKDSNKQTALPEQLLSNNAQQIKYKNDEDNLRRSFPPLNIYHR